MKALQTVLTLLAITLSGSVLLAQQIDAVEYFFGMDPGVGNGTTIPITPNDSIDQSFTLSSQNLSVGINQLHIRVRGTNGFWSPYQSIPVLIDQFPTNTVLAAESFVDADPGVGNGNPVTITSGDTINSTFVVTLPTGLAPGKHQLHVRVKGGGGTWSHYAKYDFMVAPTTPNHQIVAAEYYYDQDPGVGNGSPVSIVPEDTVSSTFVFTAPTGLAPGKHQVHVRAKGGGTWSHYAKYDFIVAPTTPNHQIVAAEYYYDQDPGIGNGIPLTFSSADTIDGIYSLKSDTLALGTYKLSIRVKSDSGQWSPTASRQLKICTSYGPKAEFNVKMNRSKVFVSDMSEYTTRYRWIYGDGNIDTLVQNPSHEYVPGHYDLCLIASNNCGSDTSCQSIVVRGISNVTPTLHANDGFMVMDIYGGGLEMQSDAFLFDNNGVPIRAKTVTYIDDTWLRAIFRLRGEPIGNYHLEVVGSSNQRDTLKNAIELQPVTPPDIWVSLNGRTKILPNRNWDYTLTIGNKGNTTAFGVPLYISATKDLQITITDSISTDSIPQAVLDSFPRFSLYIDSLSNDTSVFGAVVVPYVEPGEVRTIHLTLRAPSVGMRQFSYWTGAPLMEEWQLDSIYRSSCNFLPPCLQCITDLLGLVPAAGCAVGIMNLACSIGNNIGNPSSDNLWDLVGNIGGTFLSCTVVLNAGQALNFAIDAAGAAGGANSALQSCAPGSCLPKPRGNDDVNVVGSFDPNVKIGPIGTGNNHYILGDEPAMYSIYFENDPTATAPAQVVRITDTLVKANYDFSDFRWRAFGFGDTIVSIDEHGYSFVTDIDLGPSKNLIVRFEGDLDTATGLLTATFTSLQGDTLKIPEDPLVGFLPPNVQYPEGEGFVRFEIPLRDNPQHLDEIANKAEIIFDANAPIHTPTWRNIVDRQAPQSQVDPLSATIMDTLVGLSWGGTDPHSGILNYIVYVSVNDSAYYPWIKTSAMAATFVGSYGAKYKFYTVATDRVGNEELPPFDPQINPDAETTLQKPSVVQDPSNPKQWLAVHPNPATNSAWVSWEQSHAANIQLTLIDVSGMLAYSSEAFYPSGVHNQKVELQDLPSGIYVVRIRVDGRPIYTKLVIH